MIYNSLLHPDEGPESVILPVESDLPFADKRPESLPFQTLPEIAVPPLTLSSIRAETAVQSEFRSVLLLPAPIAPKFQDVYKRQGKESFGC